MGIWEVSGELPLGFGPSGTEHEFLSLRSAVVPIWSDSEFEAHALHSDSLWCHQLNQSRHTNLLGFQELFQPTWTVTPEIFASFFVNWQPCSCPGVPSQTHKTQVIFNITTTAFTPVIVELFGKISFTGQKINLHRHQFLLLLVWKKQVSKRSTFISANLGQSDQVFARKCRWLRVCLYSIRLVNFKHFLSDRNC